MMHPYGTDNDMRNARVDFETQVVKPSPIYRDLVSRRYRNPAGYCSWDKAALGLASEVHELSAVGGWQNADTTRRNAVTNALRVQQHGAAVYWVDAGLLESLRHTDPPQHIDLPQLFKTAVFLLPDRAVKDGDGNAIPWICVTQLMPNTYDPPVIAPDPGPEGRLVIVPKEPGVQKLKLSCKAFGYTYTKVVKVLDSGLNKCDDGSWATSATTVQVSTEDRAFLDALADTVFQLMLVLSARPDLVVEQPPRQAKKKPKARKTSDTPLLNPLWIGRGFAAPREVPLPGTGTHASPQTHWRRGHWRRVAVGPGRKDRVWRWILPTLVNP